MCPCGGQSMNTSSGYSEMNEQANNFVKKFVLDLKGFEGPLHLLLTLCRSQKVDLLKISLVELCDQYLKFISDAKKLKIELAADYLIMASWLVFLKSEILLPKENLDCKNSEELSQNLKFQLVRLDAMREAGIKLCSSNQLGRDFFKRGEISVFTNTKEIYHTASLLDLLRAYASLKTKEDFEPLHLKRSMVLSHDEALEIINKKLKLTVNWEKLEYFVSKFWWKNPQRRRTAIATNFAVFLEQARLKRIEIMQDEMFSPLYFRKLDEF